MTANIELPNARWSRSAAALWVLLRLSTSVALTLLGLTIVTFCIGRVIPIDPVIAIVGDRASADVYERVREELGLDLPLYQQYWNYLLKLLHGDLGTAVLTTRPVLEDLMRVFPATLELATVAILIGVLFGVPMGVVSAANKGKLIDHVFRLVGLLGYSVPVFWLGLVALLLFYANLNWTSGPGRLDVSYFGIVKPLTGLLLIDSLIAGETEIFWNAVSHIWLPASILGCYSLAYIARMTRSLMLAQLNQEYILTARVKGLSRGRVVWRHAFGNILVSLITVVALSYGYLLEGAVLTETVFAWPGLGRYITSALFNADMNAVLGGTIVVGTVFVGLNMLSDVAYYLVDPRAR